MTAPIKSYTKEVQLDKAKKHNPKKITGQDRRDYIDFIREKSGCKCQIPGCNNNAQDIEHPERGIRRDDRYIILICRSCHLKADGHTNVSEDEKSRIKLAGKKIAKQNWKDYNH
ncbi:MAG: hypothetical protein ABXS91_08705 [Sulfurimonas sp.]